MLEQSVCNELINMLDPGKTPYVPTMLPIGHDSPSHIEPRGHGRWFQISHSDSSTNAMLTTHSACQRASFCQIARPGSIAAFRPW